MGRNRYKIYEQEYPYFLTSNIRFGFPFFSVPAAAEIVLDSLVFLQEKRDVELTAYVIMENHLHLVAQGNELEEKIGRFKSYTAREIIDLFGRTQRTFSLRRLRWAKKLRKTDRIHQLWEVGNYPKQIISDKMMEQKIEYIHNNPVKRGFVDKPEHWRYSSARNYIGIEGLIPVTLYKGHG